MKNLAEQTFTADKSRKSALRVQKALGRQTATRLLEERRAREQLSEQVRADIPRLFAEDWSQQIHKAAAQGLLAVNLHIKEWNDLFPDEVKHYTKVHGVDYLRNLGYTVSNRQEYSSMQGGHTQHWLEVSWK